METRSETCARCGAPIDPRAASCSRCRLGEAAVAPATPEREPPVPSPGPAVPPPLPPAAQRSPEGRVEPSQAGPPEFEAEECLARGQTDRALVIASRALKQRPDNLTLLALVERARKAVLRGQRGQRLEQRVNDARTLIERGDHEAAQRIVVSALKLIPNHAGALALFGQLKTLRLEVATPEAQADRELERVARRQAQQALARALALRKSGRERAAFVEVRRGLRAIPDEPDLLALFAELQESLSRIAARHSSSRKRVFQARARMSEGRYPESRVILREVLQADPEFGPAQMAMDELEQRVRRQPTAGPLPPRPRPRPAEAVPALPQARVTARPDPRPGRSPARLQRRRRLSPVIVVAMGVGLAAGVWWLARPTLSKHRPSSTITVPIEARRSAETDPLAALDPELRSAVQGILDAYERALEMGDAQALARARPDLAADRRRSMVAPFEGATNAAVDLRVTAVVQRRSTVEVHLLHTDVIVGDARPQTQFEETIRLVRQDGLWRIG